jgi:cytochrome c biogenesis protein ResB
MKNKKVIVAIIVILVVIISALLGALAGGLFSKNQVIADGIILTKDTNTVYENTLITTYDEYNELLKKYGVSDLVYLTSGDLDQKDYIIDFIDYDEDLQINNIDITVTDAGLEIIYKVNKTLDNSNNYLMYFIPIDKGSLDILQITNREFIVE